MSKSDEFGRCILREALGTKFIRFYDKGYAYVGMKPAGGTPEKLLGISGDAQVAKKTTVGRGVAGVLTLGANYALTSSRRGDIFLVITTAKDTYTMHVPMVANFDMKAYQRILSVGQALINQNVNTPVTVTPPPQSAAPAVTASPQGDDVVAQLEKLKGLLDAGVLTQEEFTAAKARILG